MLPLSKQRFDAVKEFFISIAGQTDPGLLRPNNQDRWAHFGEGALLVVADGMGGHRAGEVAAQEVVDRLGHWHTDIELSGELAAQQLTIAVQQINRDLFAKAYTSDQLRGMGTTLCCALFLDDKMVQCHAGDSRIYRLRRGHLERLTRDDSLVADLLDLGQLEPHDVADYQYRNVVTRAVAMEPELDPHVEEVSLEEGDLFLLCSDGLTSMLEDSQIETLLQEEASLEALCENLVKKAKKRGGRDNITVVLAAVQKK